MDSPCHCYGQLAPGEHIYSVNYQYAGSEYSTYIVATNLEDAPGTGATTGWATIPALLQRGAMNFEPGLDAQRRESLLGQGNPDHSLHGRVTASLWARVTPPCSDALGMRAHWQGDQD